MNIMSRQEEATGKVFINIILTAQEIEELTDGKVITAELPELNIQIVGYGEGQEAPDVGSSS